ncbi:MAG: DUF1003 domain-containing protein [Caldilineaceae bacterium]|nr:DUF1003 domain-containing protein [Caldilineaceae bacterium]
MQAQSRGPSQSSADIVTVAALRQSLKARSNARRGPAARLADRMTAGFGSMLFLLLNCIWFVVWMVINLGWIPGVPAFDPFPFGLLTMIVSLEAIILAIVVLISQNRAARIAELREEVALQVEEISEQEITKLLELMVRLLEKQGADVSRDPLLDSMLQPTDTDKLTEALEKEVEESEVE